MSNLSMMSSDLDFVQATLNFIVPQDSKPYFESTELTGGKANIYFETEDREVSIYDMRKICENLSIDKNGFELRKHETAVSNFYDDRIIDTAYRAEIIHFLRQILSADRVVVFDFTRRSDSSSGAVNPDGAREPAIRVHADYTVASGPKRASDILGKEELDRVLDKGGRIMQLNVWRPIIGPVRRSPLAVADSSTIRSRDLIATDQIFSDRIGEIYQVAYAPAQKWYWAPEMEPNEVLFLKGWDSLDDGSAKFTPHGAFRIGNKDSNVPARESIEARCYVIYDT